MDLSQDRSVYEPPASSRIIGFVGTSAIFALVAASFFLTVSYMAPVSPPPVLTVVNLLPPASPQETPPVDKHAPEPVQKKEAQPPPTPAPPTAPVIVPIAPILQSPPVVAAQPTDPGPAEPETAAPRTQPAPPAPRLSGDAAETWEGKVLARLIEHRRYPRSAMARGRQGVPYIRFTMNREGMVLSSRLERSSGFPELDREAVALPTRAQPLPKPPDDRPGETLELLVPVEFFLR